MRQDIKHTNWITLKRTIVLEESDNVYIFIQDFNEKIDNT